MQNNGTHPLLAKLVRFYLRGRGKQRLSLIPNMPEGFVPLCREQDQIGWRNFTEGQISKQFRAIQAKFLRVRHPRRNVDAWLRGFISKLLAMTHSQWIFRCISKHHQTRGMKALATREKLTAEIERQKTLGEDAMAEGDKWMLEVDIERDTAEEQQYWLYAVEAARQAGSHALDASNGATPEWSEIVAGEEYRHIPSMNHPQPPPAETSPDNAPPKQPCSARAKPSTKTASKRKRTRAPHVPKPSTRRRSFSPSQRRANECSEEATTRDSCNLLQPFRSRILNDRRLVRNAFARPRRLQTGWSEAEGRQVSEELRAYRYANESMTQSELKRLEAQAWLSDANINMFLKAYVTDKVDRVHCYSTHFFLTSSHICSKIVILRQRK